MSDAQQLALLDDAGRVHRHAGPTERAAAEAMRRSAGTQRALVLAAFREHPEGLTDDEGAALFGWADRLKFGRRRLDLCRAGLVEGTGLSRETPLGNRAIVWRAV